MLVRQFALAALLIATASSSALAGPTYTFTGTTSDGIPNAANVGSVTLTQIDSNTVDVLVDLYDTSLPRPRFGFLNTGGKHTPFTFTISGTESGVSAAFTQPTGDAYQAGSGSKAGTYTFSLTTVDSKNTPYGSFGMGIDSTAPNGSSAAYYGDLEFRLTRTSGLSTGDFISNGTAYFAADLTNGTKTGAVAWEHDPTVTNTPEPASMTILGVGLAGVGMLYRRRRA